MKTLFLITLLALVTTGKLYAQEVEASAYVEQNVYAFQKGLEVGFVTGRYLKVSYFFQGKDVKGIGELGKNHMFHGLGVQIPVKRCDGIMVSAGMKAGFVNNQYIIVTPQVTTEIRIMGPVHLAVTAGYRAGHPTIGSKLSIHI